MRGCANEPWAHAAGRERGLWDVVVCRKSQPDRSEGLRDGDREIGEPRVLGFWRSKLGL